MDNRFINILDKFSGMKVAVIGDMIADVFLYGKPYQLSREAPVVIVKHESEKVVPGGAANTVNNIYQMGARVYPIGLVGNDANGNALRSYFDERRIDTSMLRTVDGRNTIAKMRVMAGGCHTSKQQVVRVDYDPGTHFNDSVEDQIIADLNAVADQVDGIIVSDYGYDLFSPAVIKAILAIAKKKCVVVDSHHKLPMFKGVAVITPNEDEALSTLRYDHGESPPIEKVGRKLYELVKPTVGMLITRGNEGMMVCQNNKVPLHIPIVGSDDVTDVTGAGDTVVSILTLALLAGADLSTASRIANYAAGIVVMKSGTATTSKDELSDFIKRCLDEKTTEPVRA